MKTASGTVGALCLLLAAADIGRAQVLRFDAVNVTDVVPGQDLWQYQYSVTGDSIQSGQILSVSFDYLKYANLQDPPPVPNGDWTAQVLQPDPGLPDNGSYDLVALRNNPSLLGNFGLSFEWKGGPAAPSVQSWTIYNSDFSVAASGTTVALAVPEPLAGSATAAALIGLVAWRWRFRSRSVF